MAKAPKNGTHVSIQTTVSPRYHLIYDPQRHEILLTGEQSTPRGPSIFYLFTKSLPRRDNSLSLGRGLWNKKGEALSFLFNKR